MRWVFPSYFLHVHKIKYILFIIGGKIRGGLFGKAPNLSKLGTNQDIKSTMDYRAVYNSIIEDYFGVRSKFKTYGDPRLKSLFPGNVKASQV